jgi:hypothetical protein
MESLLLDGPVGGFQAYYNVGQYDSKFQVASEFACKKKN